MKTHIVLTPANIEIEYRLAGAGSRLAAFTIDFTLQIIFSLLLGVIILFGIYNYRFATLEGLEGSALALLIISWFLIYFCYFIFLEMAMNGQSIGKKIFGLRVIRDNGQPVRLQDSLIRNLFKAVLDILYIGLFFILFSPKHKRIGDMVAGTVVVAEHYGSIGPSLQPTHLPVFNNKASRAGVEQLPHLLLSPEERDLLNMYMARKIYLPEASKQNLQHQWAKYFSQKWQVDADLIDDALLVGLLQLNEADY